MKNILLPTDFSENSKNAINYALELFKNEICTFHVLNTYTPIIYNYDYQMNAGGFLGDTVDIIRNNSLQNLNEIKKSLEEKYDNAKHQFELVSSFNTLTDEMDLIVAKHKIELIIMGTKGASSVVEVLLGTNTIHAIKKVNCPILAIPDGFFFEQPKDILFPTDYKIDYTAKHLDILEKICSIYKSKLHVLHISSQKRLTNEENTKKTKLEKLLNDVNAKFYIEEEQEVQQAINNFQKSTYVHLLMMIKNKHTFFENLFLKKVINQIGFHLTVPFLVVPSNFNLK